MKKMHIVQVSSYYPPNLGGQENAAHDLATQLAKAGHTVQVITSTEGGGKRGDTLENNVTVRRLWGFVFGHAPIMPGFFMALRQIAHKNSLVHVHIGQAFAPEMVWLAAKLYGFKYIAQLHIDFEPSGPAGILLPIYKRLLLRRVLQNASAVVVLNKKTYRIVRDFYGYTGELRIMNNGLDESYFELKRPARPLKAPEKLHLLFVGRLTSQKNVPVLLHALARTQRSIHLDIIGEGDEAEKVQEIIKNHALNNVTFHGRLPRSVVMDFYRSCDALIMPSLYEAQPLVLLEAMAAKIPIIGTNVIGVADHLKDGGIVVEPTVEGIASGIERYFTDYALLPKMISQSYHRATKVRWGHTLKKYENLYAKVLED